MPRVHLSVRRSEAGVVTDRSCTADTWYDPQGRECAYGLERGDEYWLTFHRVGTFTIQPGFWKAEGFPESGVGTRAFRDAFLHGVAPWMLQRQECDCFHGSAVLMGARVAAFAGPPERGKSTLARAWCERGGIAYGDDSVAFLIRGNTVLAAQLPQRLRVRGPAASLFAPLKTPEGDSASEVEFLYDLEPTLRPLDCIYWLEPRRHSGAAPRVALERMHPKQAFSLLMAEARWTSLRDAACTRKMVRNYLSLVHRTPVFRLSIASGLHLIPAVLNDLEQHLETVRH